jgi:hypothetical protein
MAPPRPISGLTGTGVRHSYRAERSHAVLFHALFAFMAQIRYDISTWIFISSSEAKQAQPQCLCGVAPFFLYGVMCATLHLDCIFLETIFELLICEMDWIY